ncbi:MAG: DNA polymerase III subunit delta [Oscillospiraceae bacterium]|nr:DNA polymerase III subunit delta [Oscillospiraceae bacterium]MCL2278008.1 DNA polymerase III subunit delta [Oscillospiraceae bacterium]
MAQKKSQTDSYMKLREAIKTGELERFYIFHGPERYLLERGIVDLRSHICPDGSSGFNYRRFEGRGLAIDELEDAVNTFPVFADKTLVEVHDFDIFASGHRERMRDILSDLPDYVCAVFSFDTLEFKPDGRVKVNKEILGYACVLEFAQQDSQKLVKWIMRHFRDAGRDISPADAEYLAFITGGLMTSLHGEIEKVAAFSRASVVSRKDIDAVVTPTLDAVSYELTDAIVNREHKQAARLLDELFQMREAPHKLIYSISLKMRQLLAARVCLDSKLSKRELMDMCSIRHEFQASKLMSTASKSTLEDIKKKVLACSETAMELNSTSEPESRMVELLAKLALG